MLGCGNVCAAAYVEVWISLKQQFCKFKGLFYIEIQYYKVLRMQKNIKVNSDCVKMAAAFKLKLKIKFTNASIAHKMQRKINLL